MKLELEVGDELWQRIERAARTAMLPPHDYLRRLLNERLPRPYDAAVAQEFARRLLAGDFHDPSEPADSDELAADIQASKGVAFEPTPNGVPCP